MGGEGEWVEELLEHLQFSTALPFGYAAFFGLCLLVVVGCVALMISGVAQRKSIGVRLIVGAIGIAGVLTVLGANLFLEREVDFNPVFNDSDITGTWIDGDSRLEFHGGKKVRFHFGDAYAGREPVMDGDGTWQRHNDFEIEIMLNANAKTSPPIRMIRSGDDLRMIIDDFGDPDMWDHHLGFKKGK